MLSRGRSRQVDQKFKAALDYIMNARLSRDLFVNNPMPNKQTNKPTKNEILVPLEKRSCLS